MPKKISQKQGNIKALKPRSPFAFTLIELLTVVAIIVILAGLVLMSAGWAQRKAATSRAEAEIKAMSTGCESYKTDQGIYPMPLTQIIGSGTATISVTQYATSSTAPKALYQALSGDGNNALVGGLIESSGTVTPGQTQYMPFKTKMLAGLDSSLKVTGSVYVQDPFQYPYGYYAPNLSGTSQTSGTDICFNPNYDLWSTAGKTAISTGTIDSSWIKNW